MTKYPDEFQLLKMNCPVNTNIPANDLKQLKEIYECWNECLIQNEEEKRGWCSPMQTMQDMLGIDDHFKLLDDVPTQFIMEDV